MIDDFFTDIDVAEYKKRHITHTVKVGNIKIGGGHPVVVQSMALGGTRDLLDYAEEVVSLARAGSELIRVAFNSKYAAKSIPFLQDKLVKNGFNDRMIIGCGQYEVEQLLREYPEESKLLAKIRINPGNIGFGEKRDKKFERVIEYAIKYSLPVRIGVNWGSLDKNLVAVMMDRNAQLQTPDTAHRVYRKAMIASAISSAQRAEDIGLPANMLVLSCKTSRVQDLIAIYMTLAKISKYALHLGLTEAGMGRAGIVSTVSALSGLLQCGIGDTIRASLTPKPNELRTEEVLVCQEVLQALELRYFSPKTTSCPGCSRTNGSYFQLLTQKINEYIAHRMPEWKSSYPGIEAMRVAVMGCIVNGPGESKHADIGISLPGSGEKSAAVVFIDGKKHISLHGDKIYEQFIDLLESYASQRYSSIIS